MRLKHCNWRGCTRLVKQGTDFCPTHKQADLERKQAYINAKTKRESNVKGMQLKTARMSHYNHTVRDAQANLFYHSVQWKHMRDYIYARDMGVCQVCLQALDGRLIVDHCHPLKTSPSEKLDPNNLWCLCYKCHAAKTKVEESIKSQPNGTNKLAHISKEWWINVIKEKIK